MKIVALFLTVAVLISGAFFLGKGIEAQLIQSTCDDPNGVTMLGGSPYICLNGATWNAIVEQLKGRGA